MKKATCTGRRSSTPAAAKRLDHLEAGEDAEVAVEAASRGDRVDVGSDHHGAGGGIRAGVRRDDVADAVDRHGHPEIVHPRHDEVPPGPVLISQRQTADTPLPVRTVHRTDLSERLEPGPQPITVDPQRGEIDLLGAHRASSTELEGGDLVQRLDERRDGAFEQLLAVLGRGDGRVADQP